MRMFAAFLLVLLFATPLHAQDFWLHNGSVVALESDGTTRKIRYWQPRSGLPVAPETILFDGHASGSRYFGKAYVFSSSCGAIAYDVSGGVDVARRSIILSGRAPVVDAGCNVIRFRDDVLIFSYNGCGCECGDEPELSGINPPPPTLNDMSQAQEGTSCPYLFAWNEQESSWRSYGKIIRDARGDSHELTELIKLSAFATKFRLSEEEAEHSFIDQAELKIELKDGSQIVARPETRSLIKRDKHRLYIPAFRAVEFDFKLPNWVKREDIAQASISITGYYESLANQPICVRPKISRQ